MSFLHPNTNSPNFLYQAELGEQKERERKLEQEMGAAVTGRARLEEEVASLRKKLADSQRSVQRSQRHKESYMVQSQSLVMYALIQAHLHVN